VHPPRRTGPHVRAVRRCVDITQITLVCSSAQWRNKLVIGPGANIVLACLKVSGDEQMTKLPVPRVYSKLAKRQKQI